MKNMKNIIIGLCLVSISLCIGCLPSKEEVDAVLTRQESKGGRHAITLKDGRKVIQYIIPFENVDKSRWHYVYVVEENDGNISSTTTNRLISEGKTTYNKVESIVIEGQTFKLVPADSAEKQD